MYTYMGMGRGSRSPLTQGSHSPLTQKGSHSPPKPQYFQYVTQPFRVKPGDKGTFRGTGEPLGGTWGHM